MQNKGHNSIDHLISFLTVADHKRLFEQGVIEDVRRKYASELSSAYEAGDRDTSREVHDGLERIYLNGHDYARENSKRST